MQFVKTDNLEKGMRLARPIYNRNGVLLYDRNTKLSKQAINSVKNFNLIGVYVLEPGEPMPPLTSEDIEFERFQTMNVFGLREDIELLMEGKEPINLDNMIKLIYQTYAKKDKKLSAIQSIRSSGDYTYKHALMVAILSAAMGARLKLTQTEIYEVILAALVHDMGVAVVSGLEYIEDSVKLIVNYESRMEEKKPITDVEPKKELQAKILFTANTYDDMTAMKLEREPSSEIVAVRYLLRYANKYGDEVVGALIDSMRMLYPGVCVELSNKSTGIVIMANGDNVLRPLVLGFRYNEIYNLMADDVYEKVQIKDIMKTMDKRVRIDEATIDEYMKQYNKPFRD